MMRTELSDLLSFWEYNKGKTCFFYGLEREEGSPQETFRQLNSQKMKELGKE